MTDKAQTPTGKRRRTEVFAIREVRPDWEVQQTHEWAHYGQAKVFDQFMALVKRTVALGCLLEQATYEYRTRTEVFLELTGDPWFASPQAGDAPISSEKRTHLLHVYEWRGTVSGSPEAMERLFHSPDT